MKPNVVFVFADQMRAQATGYAGDPNARTPCLDRLASRSVHLSNAVAGCPVCSPYRASLLTGQHPTTHGVFVNDVCLNNAATPLAQAFRCEGYDTAYIGKWHLDGHGRSNFIPPERRQGFQFWRGMECTHRYNDSLYYAEEDPAPRRWEGYDAVAQTREAQRWLEGRKGQDAPFLLLLSWGPPHNPYETAPEEWRAMFRSEGVQLRPNVPPEKAESARKDLAGYYAHIAALDACVGDLCSTLERLGMAEDTVFVFTSDHGDMLGSQGERRKQRPWDESVRVPFLLRWPAEFGDEPCALDAPFNAPDIMPTLLGLCGAEIPSTVEGADFSGYLRGGADPSGGAALLSCVSPFGEWTRRKEGGREYRGVRTPRHTYVRDLQGPWLLYDNLEDPYQMHNLAGKPKHAALQGELDVLLHAKLKEAGDDFLPGEEYIMRWGYVTDEDGTVPYTA